MLVDDLKSGLLAPFENRMEAMRRFLLDADEVR
jgi:hypothetical protein